jgi:hypothetical protein
MAGRSCSWSAPHPVEHTPGSVISDRGSCIGSLQQRSHAIAPLLGNLAALVGYVTWAAAREDRPAHGYFAQEAAFPRDRAGIKVSAVSGDAMSRRCTGSMSGNPNPAVHRRPLRGTGAIDPPATFILAPSRRWKADAATPTLPEKGSSRHSRSARIRSRGRGWG